MKQNIYDKKVEGRRVEKTKLNWFDEQEFHNDKVAFKPNDVVVLNFWLNQSKVSKFLSYSVNWDTVWYSVFTQLPYLPRKTNNVPQTYKKNLVWLCSIFSHACFQVKQDDIRVFCGSFSRTFHDNR